ncbi:MAG TPA: hypothetical protein VG365_07880 [Solirubrobacteraceae bacterium]|nr:hypothetical protein [Solirubrobacteraceae bacterium]
MAHLRVGDRDRDDHPRGIVQLDGAHGGQHRRPGREPVVHQDHGPTGQVGWRSLTAVGALAPRQLAPLLGVDRLDPVGRKRELLEDRLVQHAHAAGRDRSERQLLVTWHAQLAHEKHIQGSIEGAGDLRCNRNAATRKSKHHDVVAPRVFAQPSREQSAGAGSVREPSVLHHGLC